MSKKPIEIFKDIEQFLDCCKYWQHKLFLDDWFIKFTMVDKPIEVDEEILYGICEFNYFNKEAVIKIFNGNLEENDRIVCKDCAELTIIHELLHIRPEYICARDVGYEDEKGFHDYVFHQAIETMAKSLLMVKYNLDYDYFYKG